MSVLSYDRIAGSSSIYLKSNDGNVTHSHTHTHISVARTLSRAQSIGKSRSEPKINTQLNRRI